MTRFYIGMIKRGKMTIDKVPEKWRDEVNKELNSVNIDVDEEVE